MKDEEIINNKTYTDKQVAEIILIAVERAKSQTIQQVRDVLGVTQINNNLHTSFFGTMNDALKKGYTMDKHYVIVDWIFFHDLLKKEKELLSQLDDVSLNNSHPEAQNFNSSNNHADEQVVLKQQTPSRAEGKTSGSDTSNQLGCVKRRFIPICPYCKKRLNKISYLSGEYTCCNNNCHTNKDGIGGQFYGNSQNEINENALESAGNRVNEDIILKNFPDCQKKNDTKETSNTCKTCGKTKEEHFMNYQGEGLLCYPTGYEKFQPIETKLSEDEK